LAKVSIFVEKVQENEIAGTALILGNDISGKLI
jgi:hypothetical protein